MAGQDSTNFVGELLSNAAELTAMDLCRSCGVAMDDLVEWVNEGILDTQGADPQLWQFRAAALARARVAARLSRDLGVNAAGIALVLDLVEERDALYARLSAVLELPADWLSPP